MCWRKWGSKAGTSIWDLSRSELLLRATGAHSCWWPLEECMGTPQNCLLSREEARESIHQLAECCTRGSKCLPALRWRRKERQAGTGGRKLSGYVETARQLRVSTRWAERMWHMISSSGTALRVPTQHFRFLVGHSVQLPLFSCHLEVP